MKYFALGFAFLSTLTIAKANFKIVGTDELTKIINAKNVNFIVYDANGEKTRKEMGVIPGAKLLSSSDKYDVAKELPADKCSKMVFYCGGPQCTASHDAAERAIKNGYTDVSVYTEGISGWIKAGKSATKL